MGIMEQEMVKLLINCRYEEEGTNPRPIAERMRMDEIDNCGSSPSMRSV